MLGVLVGLLGLYLARFRREFWARPRMVALLGILVVIAPFAPGYTSTTGAVWYDVILGVVVALVAFWGTRLAVSTRPTHA